MNSRLDIRAMTAAEVDIAVGWAAAEGWNPGLDDARCFRAEDPDGFLMAFLDGEPAAAPKLSSAKPSISKNRRREQQKLEQKVADAEQQLAALEDELADPAAWANEY